jgi:hypothetical protein
VEKSKLLQTTYHSSLIGILNFHFCSVFILDYEYDLPQVIISFVRLLLLSGVEWEKVREKSKPPKAKLEGVLCDILISALDKRLDEYPTTIEVICCALIFLKILNGAI